MLLLAKHAASPRACSAVPWTRPSLTAGADGEPPAPLGPCYHMAIPLPEMGFACGAVLGPANCYVRGKTLCFWSLPTKNTNCP
jgi:hypothetical protein